MTLRAYGCPACGHPGASTKCWECGWEDGAEAATTDTTPEARNRPAIPDTRSEAQRKADAKDAVELLGFHVIDTEQGYRADGSTRVMRGFPDWLCMGHGLTVYVEWKSADGRQTKEQKVFERMCRECGVPYAVCRTTEEVVAFLRPLTGARGAA